MKMIYVKYVVFLMPSSSVQVRKGAKVEFSLVYVWITVQVFFMVLSSRYDFFSQKLTACLEYV
uniref:Uncharacterized protein n=1 Tax=Arundo donax TaxID=35708 RepID=A0A0A9FZZ5_ARUDO